MFSGPLATDSRTNTHQARKAAVNTDTRVFRGVLCMDILTDGFNSQFLVTNMGWHTGALCGTLSPSVLGPQPPQSLQELTAAPARCHSRAHRHNLGEGIWLHLHVCEHMCTNVPLYMCARVCVYCACVHTCTVLHASMHMHACTYAGVCVSAASAGQAAPCMSIRFSPCSNPATLAVSSAIHLS